MNMETKEEKERVTKELHTLKLYLYNKLYEYSSDGEFLHDAFFLYDHMSTPLKDDLLYKRAIYRKAMNLRDQGIQNKTDLGKYLDDDPSKKNSNLCKAVFVNEFFKTYISYLTQDEFLDNFETVIK